MSLAPLRNTVSVLAALTLLGVAGPSRASLYEIDLHPYDGSNLICGPSVIFVSEAFPVEDGTTSQVNDVVSNSTSTQEAIAGMGYVGMKHSVSHRVNRGFGRLFGTCSTVRTVIDDLQVVGPPGQVTASLNANFRAMVEVDTLASRSSIRVKVSLRSTQGGAGTSNTVEVDFSESGEIDMLINSGPLTFDMSETLEAELEIEMRLVAGVTPDAETVLNVFDVLDETEGYGLHFSTDEVLTLPAGYTANSADGDVGDNQWGGTVPTTSRTWGAVKSLYR